VGGGGVVGTIKHELFTSTAMIVCSWSKFSE